VTTEPAKTDGSARYISIAGCCRWSGREGTIIVAAGDVGNVHGDRPGGESGSIGRLGHAGVTSRMSHDRAPTRRLSCRALLPAVALVVTAAAHMTAAICEGHSWVRLAVGVLPRRWNRRFPKQLGEWLAKQA
jgi:hypothetical protein